MTAVQQRRLDYKFATTHGGKKYNQLISVSDKVLPRSVDNRQWCPSPKDQGQEGSCSAFSSIAHARYWQAKMGKEVQEFSENFQYYSERELEGTVDQDAGAATLEDACKVLLNTGACEESIWPYDQATLFTKPPPEAYANAIKYRPTSYYGMFTENQFKHCLAAGWPVLHGFAVPASFMDQSVAETGIWQPQTNEQIVGGHAVLRVGYDDDKQAYLTLNSWGAYWGMNGYFWMPYSFAHSDMCDDHFTLR